MAMWLRTLGMVAVLPFSAEARREARMVLAIRLIGAALRVLPDGRERTTLGQAIVSTNCFGLGSELR